MDNDMELHRDQVLAQYKVRGGRIVSPGKFEGEPIYAPWFYEGGLEGLEVATDDDGSQIFQVGADDLAQYPEIPPDARWIRVYEDEQGFVHLSHYDTCPIEL